MSQRIKAVADVDLILFDISHERLMEIADEVYDSSCSVFSAVNRDFPKKDFYLFVRFENAYVFCREISSLKKQFREFNDRKKRKCLGEGCEKMVMGSRYERKCDNCKAKARNIG